MEIAASAGAMSAVDRRGLLAGLGCTALLTALASPAALAAMRSETRLISATAMPPSEPSQPLSYRLFYDLSRYLTARSELDHGFARDLHAAFREEEWGWASAGRLYQLVRDGLDHGFASAPELLASGTLAPGDQWYGAHLVSAWYDGIHWYEGKATRIGYQQALMWETVGDLLPVQGLSDRPYGYWAERPADTDERQPR